MVPFKKIVFQKGWTNKKERVPKLTCQPNFGGANFVCFLAFAASRSEKKNCSRFWKVFLVNVFQNFSFYSRTFEPVFFVIFDSDSFSWLFFLFSWTVFFNRKKTVAGRSMNFSRIRSSQFDQGEFDEGFVGLSLLSNLSSLGSNESLFWPLANMSTVR